MTDKTVPASRSDDTRYTPRSSASDSKVIPSPQVNGSGDIHATSAEEPPASGAGNIAVPVACPPLPILDQGPVIFGDYELVQELGRGGMGVVYKARQHKLGRLVALKMVLNGWTDSVQLRRFLHEARAAAALDHPAIVPVFDVGEIDRLPYFTMAYIEGHSLATLLKRDGPLNPVRAAALVSRIAEGVEYAHQRGIIHRDLKPDNIILDGQGNPRITDFGLARRQENGPNITGTGIVLGTPSYMAPEQAQARKDVGPLADVYSLGAVLQALLTGHAPFNGQTSMEVLIKVIQEPPMPLRQINPDLPAPLETLCLRCLHKDPVSRFSSAGELADELRRWVGSMAPTPRTDPWMASPSTPLVASRPDLLVPVSQEEIASAPATPSADTHPGNPDPASRSTAARPSSRASAAEPESRTSSRLAVAVALVALLGVGAGLLVRYLSRPGTPDAVSRDDEADKPLNQVTRQDFPFQVTVLGQPQPSKGVYSFVVEKPIALRLESTRDAYVGIWSLESDGTVRQILPNDYEDSYFVKAGQPRIVPGNNKYDYIPMLNKQTEHLRIVASTEKWDPVKGEKEGPFILFRGLAAKNWDSSQRAVIARERKMPQRGMPTAEVSEVILPYQVKPARP